MRNGPVSPEGRTGRGTERLWLPDSSGGPQSHGEKPMLEQGNRETRCSREGNDPAIPHPSVLLSGEVKESGVKE